MINRKSNRKVMIIHLIVGLIRKILWYKMRYFREPHTNINSKIEKIKFDLSDYATKSELKTQQVSIYRNLLKM